MISTSMIAIIVNAAISVKAIERFTTELNSAFRLARSFLDTCAANAGSFAFTQLIPTVSKAVNTAMVIPSRPASTAPSLAKASGVNS